jgi:hypothetical protein
MTELNPNKQSLDVLFKDAIMFLNDLRIEFN